MVIIFRVICPHSDISVIGGDGSTSDFFYVMASSMSFSSKISLTYCSSQLCFCLFWICPIPVAFFQILYLNQTEMSIHIKLKDRIKYRRLRYVRWNSRGDTEYCKKKGGGTHHERHPQSESLRHNFIQIFYITEWKGLSSPKFLT